MQAVVGKGENTKVGNTKIWKLSKRLASKANTKVGGGGGRRLERGRNRELLH